MYQHASDLEHAGAIALSNRNQRRKQMSTATATATKTNSLRDYGTRTDMYKVDPRIVEIEQGHNPRNYDLPENRAHLDELKASIAIDGVRLPISVRQEKATGKVILVDGECRIRACLELIADGTDIKTVPAIVVPGGNEKERLYFSLTANTGKPLSTWECGTAFQRLINFGDTSESVSKRLGYSLRFVNEALELADAPEAIKHLLSEQAVTPSLAVHELRTKAAPEAIESLREKAAAAKANGQKIARKTQENKVPNPTRLLKLVGELIESVEDDIFSDSTHGSFVKVYKTLIRKLSAFVHTPQKIKA